MMKYDKILALGDPAIQDIFDSPCIIEEKIDGSQFRFGIDEKGMIFFGSKGVDYSDERPPDKMFVPAITVAKEILNNIGIQKIPILFVCEYLSKPKHNTMAYDRVPVKSLVLLEVFLEGQPVPYEQKLACAMDMGLEVPQLLKKAYEKPTMEELKALLEKPSMLGKVPVEGIVIKNYSKRFFMHNKTHPYFAKYVREEFKEENKKNWNQGVPLEDQLLGDYPKEPRWRKAVQHLKERGELESAPRDIAKLLPEIEKDFEEECQEAIKERLYGKFRHSLLAGMKRGFAEWYKDQLAEAGCRKD